MRDVVVSVTYLPSDSSWTDWDFEEARKEDPRDLIRGFTRSCFGDVQVLSVTVTGGSVRPCRVTKRRRDLRLESLEGRVIDLVREHEAMKAEWEVRSSSPVKRRSILDARFCEALRQGEGATALSYLKAGATLSEEALVAAVGSGRREMVELFLGQGGNPQSVRALEAAVERGDVATVALLVGDDEWAIQRVLSLAVERGNRELVARFLGWRPIDRGVDTSGLLRMATSDKGLFSLLLRRGAPFKRDGMEAARCWAEALSDVGAEPVVRGWLEEDGVFRDALERACLYAKALLLREE